MKGQLDGKPIMNATELILQKIELNKTVDWRQYTKDFPLEKTKKGLQAQTEKRQVSIVSPVKNQMAKGVCASSYAFAVASALESSYRQRNIYNEKANKSLELSVQQLMDCTNIKRPETSTAY